MGKKDTDKTTKETNSKASNNFKDQLKKLPSVKIKQTRTTEDFDIINAMENNGLSVLDD